MTPTTSPRRWARGVAWVVVALFGGVAGSPVSLDAQPSSPELRVGAGMRGAAGLSQLQGARVAQGRGGVFLTLSPDLRIGGEAVGLATGTGSAGQGNPEPAELLLGHGGIRIEHRARSGSRWWVGTLVGPGAARLRAPGQATDLATRTLLVFEPDLRWEAGTLGPLRWGAGASARLTLGGSDLPGVRPRDLRGLSVTLHAEWIRDP